MNNIPNEIKEARKARQCQGDDCEANHCPKCGAHTLGWLDTFQRCSACELEEEEMKFMKEAKEIRDGDIRRANEDTLAAEMEADAQAAMFDDDPNPYHGTYSEE